jgi:hypothetical protein
VPEAREVTSPALGLVNPTLFGLARAAPSPGLGLANPIAAAFGLGQAPQREWTWNDVELKEFLGRMELTYGAAAPTITHRDPLFRSFFLTTRVSTRSTPPILMTKTVYDGFRKANPQTASVQRGWWKPVSLFVPGYSGGIFGADLIFPN